MMRIGVIDSGVGGLTVVKEIEKQYPAESVLYFGDNAHCPYGEKSEDEIRQYVYQMLQLMDMTTLKALVIACNTVASFMYKELQERLPFPVISVLHPVLEWVGVSSLSHIGVIGTTKTIATDVHKTYLQAFGKDVFPLACPAFVPAIEANAPEEQMQVLVKEVLFPLTKQPLDALILGCTHYPLIASTIQKVIGEGSVLLDPAVLAVKALGKTLRHYSSNPLHSQFFTSGDATVFSEQATRILGRSIVAQKKSAFLNSRTL